MTPSHGKAELSIIIPARDAEAWLAAQLEAVSEQVGDAIEVVLADNGSTDRTNDVFRAYAAQAGERWRLIDASAVPGQAYARNVGAELSDGDILLFLDADDVIAPGYISAMRRALMDDDFVAARLDYDQLNPAWTRSLEPPQVQDIPIALAFLPAAAGGSLGIRRALFEALGGFDTGTSPLEDADLCWRAQLGGGHDLTFVSDAVLHYRNRTDLRGIFRRGRAHGIARTALYARFRNRGMPRRHWRAVLSFYFGVFPMAFRARTRADLAGLLGTFGVRLGILRGCVKNRVWYL